MFVTILMLFAVWQTVLSQETVTSPDGRLKLDFEMNDSVPYYSLYRDGKPVVLPSKMAADFPEHYEPFMDAFQFIKDGSEDADGTVRRLCGKHQRKKMTGF